MAHNDDGSLTSPASLYSNCEQKSEYLYKMLENLMQMYVNYIMVMKE
jgi:hypothetical protein